jgi:hypothetical protein
MLPFACGSKEMDVSFGCFGGNAAKTTEKAGYFLAAAGEKSHCSLSKYTDCVRSCHSQNLRGDNREHLIFASGRAEETIYFVRFGGEAAKTNEKDCSSLLPQAKKAIAA